MYYKKLRTLSLKRFSIPKEHSIRRTLRSFTIAEKAVFYFLVLIFALSGIKILLNVSEAYLVEVPVQGGSLVEGVIGNPRFVNPVLAISEADKNLSSLIYSGLISISPTGETANELASDVKISDDRLNYTVIIRDDATFHDGMPVTAEDVIFTLQKITNPAIKSPRSGDWAGIGVEKIDEKTVSFRLRQAYNPFIFNLTLGILPKHIWKNVSDDEFSFSQFNTLPVGSGPYKVDVVERNSGGIPNLYVLVPFENSLDNSPFIKKLTFKFYSSEIDLINAFNSGQVESMGGISSEKITELKTSNSNIVSSPLPRVFAVFFNQSQSRVLFNKEVRRALDIATPKNEIVEKVLGGYGTVIEGPIPAGLYPWTILNNDSALTTEQKLEESKAILAEAGWKSNEETGILEKKSGSATMSLSFSISTGDAPELRQVANELANAWRNIGAQVEVLVFETGDLNQNVIRPRSFDALLFGEVIGREKDLYPFWHSSQKTDPGLNIPLYVNGSADRYLDSARSSHDPQKVEEAYKAFVEEVKTDIPAVFLYTPSYIYVIPNKVKAVELESLTVSQDRFLGIRDWYIETDKVWRIFVN